VLAEEMGFKVRLVLGKEANIKITTPEDLELAQAILKSRRGG
jgi:2-C-methyl-D-erythritol 4-phosphate cytidylyltransferase